MRGHKNDISRSWDHSRKEAFRLVEHFSKELPHRVTSTIALNRCRWLIITLTKSLLSISNAIELNVGVHEDREVELLSLRAKSAILRQRLVVEKIELHRVSLDKPRMVCTNAYCVDYRDDGSGNGTVVTMYKTICHDECYLTTMQRDLTASPEILKYKIFDTLGRCTRCCHHWEQHVHVLFQLKEKMTKVTDPEVESQLARCLEEIRLLDRYAERSERLHTEYHGEKGEVERAVLRLIALVKHNSIILFNDTTPRYLDEVLIPKANGDAIRLALQESRQSHEKFVKTIRHIIELAPAELPRYVLSEKEINRQLKHLYNTTYFGGSLEQACAGIKTMHARQSRKRACKRTKFDSSR